VKKEVAVEVEGTPDSPTASSPGHGEVEVDADSEVEGALVSALSEAQRRVVSLSARNENLLSQLDDGNAAQQSDELEKCFMRSMADLNASVHAQHRQSLSAHCAAREEALQKQIRHLDEALSETKRQLLNAQVRQVNAQNGDTENANANENENADARLNGDNAECLRLVCAHIQQRLDAEIERNRVLCAELEAVRDREGEREEMATDAEADAKESNSSSDSAESKKLLRLSKKLAILKAEVNRSAREMREKLLEERRGEAKWSEATNRLRAQNEALLASNHRNRAEVKRMKEERRLLTAKLAVCAQHSECLRRRIGNKDEEVEAVRGREEETAKALSKAMQSAGLLKETVRRLQQRVHGLRRELATTTEHCQDSTDKYLRLLAQRKEKKEEKKKTEEKREEKKEEAKEEDEGVQTLKYLLKQKREKLNCAVCKEREKQVMLAKCMHMFCRQCIKEQQAARNRACPLCKKKFDPNSDVKQVTF